MYTLEQMKLAYEAGYKNDNFLDLIKQINLNIRCAACNKEVETHQLCVKCVTQMIDNDY